MPTSRTGSGDASRTLVKLRPTASRNGATRNRPSRTRPGRENARPASRSRPADRAVAGGPASAPDDGSAAGASGVVVATASSSLRGPAPRRAGGSDLRRRVALVGLDVGVDRLHGLVERGLHVAAVDDR